MGTSHPFYFYQYIPNEGLQALNRYKYSCTDKSLLCHYVLQPFWRKAIDFFPSVLAPNLITLIGFFGILLSYTLTAYYAPTLTEELPSWVYLLNAVLLFFYQTWDALDGKQARRTGTSSPLGELFDHGCDAITAVLVALITISAYRLGDSWIGFFTVFVAMVTFFMSQWEVYFTGSLYLGEINVTEAQVGMMLIQLSCFFFGPSFWQRTIEFAGYSLQYSHALSYATIGVALFNNVVFVSNVIKLCREKPELTEKAIAYASPAITSAVLILTWAYLSPYLALRQLNVFALGFGFMYCNLVGRIVTMRVCESPFETFYYFLLPLPTLVLNAFFEGSLFNQDAAVIAYAVLAIGFYLHFGLSVIKEMTSHLGIHALSIPYPNPATAEDPWVSVFPPSAFHQE
eukprot:TRINITY_DN9127_c0_g1_i1.p1 TRINITY_DN9127_c0_g1~~TRINITY_DN9127_c0_g1_i1.p1  ORF type:complete len:415 (-),score=87.71 TRINITY_DN9127_c0_g1_i1:195-1394(-)